MSGGISLYGYLLIVTSLSQFRKKQYKITLLFKNNNILCCQLRFLQGYIGKESTLTVQDPLAGRSLGEVSHKLLGALGHPQLALAVAVSWRRRGGHGRGAAAQALQGMSVEGQEEGLWLVRSNKG